MVRSGSCDQPDSWFTQEVPAWSSSKDKASIIMIAARILFEQNGIHSTSVTQIAREVGITRELFYYYYANKSEVTDRVVKVYAEEICARWRDRVANAKAEPEFTLALIEVLREFLYVGDGAQPSPRVAVLFEAQAAVTLLGIVSESIREHMKKFSGRIRSVDDEALVLITEHGVMGMFALLEAHPNLDGEKFVRGLDGYWRMWYRK